jgi:hypothetical protein
MDGLSRYDRATVGLWRRGPGLVASAPVEPVLRDAAVHAVLAGLRRWDSPRGLLTAYADSPRADFALVASLVGCPERSELARWLRDAAFHERWRELRPDDKSRG